MVAPCQLRTVFWYIADLRSELAPDCQRLPKCVLRRPPFPALVEQHGQVGVTPAHQYAVLPAALEFAGLVRDRGQGILVIGVRQPRRAGLGVQLALREMAFCELLAILRDAWKNLG